ncbi:SIR2 family protein [Microbacterium sp.]|uniref:SIR2 family protein n=1 Tax=Microbacterium sp. TaxID=51671 RepID=UPI003C715BB9
MVIPFVGSGASYTSNLPSWGSLVNDVAKRLGFDVEVFQSQGSYPQLFDYFLSVSAEKTLEKYSAELSKLFTRATVNFAPSAVHRELTTMNVEVVYTTNYDDLLERAFIAAGREVVPVITYADLATRAPDGAVQVVKYHGDFSVPETLVLSERQYFDRMALDTAMDVRLRADALSRSLLFIGYSLSDMNVRYLLYKLNKERAANSSQPSSRGRERVSYLVSASIGEVQKEVLRSRYNVESIELQPGYAHQDEYVAELLEYCRS